MAWTNVGFDGTINEAQWASLAGLLGNGYVAAGNGDCLATAVPGARSVSVAAGSLYGDGILSTNSAPETVAMTTPVNGQWYVIALRRTWATNTAALVAIAGATTTTTTPTAPPTSFPTLNTNVGVLTDQPIAWAWCNSANTTVVVYDIRLQAVKSLPPVVASAAERDAKFMTPTQGLQVWRNDLGVVETYYGLYNASTNAGGLDVAGWTTNNRQVGLRPIQPTSAVIATGTGSANALGVVTFSGATAISLNGVFTSEYKSYRLVIAITQVTNTSDVSFRFRASGTDNSSLMYNRMATITNANATTGYFATTNDSKWVLGAVSSATNTGGGVFDITDPVNGTRKTITGTFSGFSNSQSSASAIYGGGTISTGALSFDGFTIYPSANTISGTIQVFGYND